MDGGPSLRRGVVKKGAKVSIGYGCKDLSGYAYHRVEVKYEGVEVLQYCNVIFKRGAEAYLEFIKNNS